VRGGQLFYCVLGGAFGLCDIYIPYLRITIPSTVLLLGRKSIDMRGRRYDDEALGSDQTFAHFGYDID